ncbi:MAG: deoxyguanosinetriphosphate triphosphohydrolase [Planctomycetota bacterium]
MANTESTPRFFGIVDTDRILEREHSDLAPYAMKASESLGRRFEESPSAFRTCFQRDRDRIVHSTAFRRLEYKTQVFVNHEGDHYRTRLTHTLEVAQISRSIARSLGLNEDLVEAISLAHDLGHPPFGHSGEDALDELMSDFGGFNHNVHSLRVVDVLESKYPDFDGVNLSFEIRESIAKHGDAFRGDPSLAGFRPEWGPLLEAQLSDLADSLAYTNHDIDDGIRSEFITVEDLRDVTLWREAEAEACERWPEMDRKMLVAKTVSLLIDRQVRDLVESTHGRLQERGIDSVDAVRACDTKLVAFSDEMTKHTKEMLDFLYERLYRHHRTLKMAEKAKRFLRAIFTEYARSPRQLPPWYQQRAEEESVERAICDYIAGMTDRYCQEEYQRLFHPFERL